MQIGKKLNMRVNDIKRIDSLVARLRVQQARMQESSGKSVGGIVITPAHDADFYTILLRRVYRKINKLAQEFHEIAEIKNQNTDFLEKIRIRDHFDKVEAGNWEEVKKLGSSRVDHLTDFKDSLVSVMANVTIVNSVMDNKIISGPYEWDLKTDHSKLLEIMEQVKKILEVQPESSSSVEWIHFN